MPYFLCENFKSGLDVRKSALTAPAGTLTILKNAAITPGGEIRKRKAFTKVADLTGTFGLAAIGTTLVAFTKNVQTPNPGIKDPVSGASPTDVTLEYHRIPNTSPTAVMTDYDVFDGKLYLVMSDPTPSPPTNTLSGPTLPVGIADGTTYLQTSDNTIYVWKKTTWEQWAPDKRVGRIPARGYNGTTYRNLTSNNIYVANYAGEWDDWRPSDKGAGVPCGTDGTRIVSQSASGTGSTNWNGGIYPGGGFAGLFPWASGTSYNSTPVGQDAPTYMAEGNTYLDTSNGNVYVVKAKKWATWYPDGSGAFMPSPQMDGYTVTDYNTGKNWITKGKFWEPFNPAQTVTTLPAGIADGTPFKNTTDNKLYVWKTSLWTEWKVTIQAQNPHYYFDDRDKVNDQLIQEKDLTWSWSTKTNPNKNTYQETEGSGMGYFVRAYKSKLYCVGDKYLRFSAVNNAFLWEAAANPNDNSRDGAGYVNVSVQEGGSSRLNGVEIYYDKLALFSELSTQMWAVVSDPKQNALGQILRQTGTKAPWSVQQYGSGDILFLASSGIRSLKARDISNSAAVSDIGSPIDDLVRSIPDNDKVYCRSVLEPVIGRVWFAFRKQIFLLSFFPGPNITAWSTFETPFDIEYIVACGDRLFIRSGNDLYLYGGVGGEDYDTSPVEVRLPFLDGSKPGHMKMFQAIDATVQGTWDIRIAYDFDAPDAEEQVAVVTSPTWNKGRYELTGYASHMSLRFYCDTDGPATVSNAAIHYMMASDSD